MNNIEEDIKASPQEAGKLLQMYANMIIGGNLYKEVFPETDLDQLAQFFSALPLDTQKALIWSQGMYTLLLLQ